MRGLWIGKCSMGAIIAHAAQPAYAIDRSVLTYVNRMLASCWLPRLISIHAFTLSQSRRCAGFMLFRQRSLDLVQRWVEIIENDTQARCF